MMFLTLTLLILSVASVNAQVTIGSTADPHAGAILDLQSTTQGFKLPNVALNSDLTQFVLPEDETSTPENAIGMLVFNTNTDIGVGIYVWNGTNWIRVDNEHGKMGADLVVGSNTYRTYTFPGSLGTWMVDPSKEGTPDYTTYTGKQKGERGYYYKYEHAAGACPAGWRLPTPDEWLNVFTYVYVIADNATFNTVCPANVRGGIILVDGTSRFWDDVMCAWTSETDKWAEYQSPHYTPGLRWLINNTQVGRASSVICMKNP
jgi:hypothetical protein